MARTPGATNKAKLKRMSYTDTEKVSWKAQREAEAATKQNKDHGGGIASFFQNLNDEEIENVHVDAGMLLEQVQRVVTFSDWYKESNVSEVDPIVVNLDNEDKEDKVDDSGDIEDYDSDEKNGDE